MKNDDLHWHDESVNGDHKRGDEQDGDTGESEEQGEQIYGKYSEDHTKPIRI